MANNCWTYLVSDDYGEWDPNYDAVFGNIVRGASRVSLIQDSYYFADSRDTFMTWTETGEWHDWDRVTRERTVELAAAEGQAGGEDQ